MKALLSVYDKAGIAEFARSLDQAGFELVSTGGTHRTLSEEAGLPVMQVSDLTGFPEILDGRVKTLHPRVHAGILARRSLSSHSEQMAEHEIDAIDLVAVNLYPFVETVTRPDASLADALENIDIGGPTMVRAAAKNFPDVIVVVDPKDYEWIAARLLKGREMGSSTAGLDQDERRELAGKAFQHVALYDSAVSRYLAQNGAMQVSSEVTFGYRRLRNLRYGENPHQTASLHADPLSSGGVARARQLQGKELSYNNILDADAAWRVVTDFDSPAVAVIKHSNPCGLAVHDDQVTAYQRAHEGDPVSAYGGIVGFNRPVSGATAEAMKGIFYEVVVAPGYDAEAMELFASKKNLRVLEVGREDISSDLDLRPVSGGALIQSTDAIEDDPSSWRVVTERLPTDAQMDDLVFAWRAAKHVKSNAIIIAVDRAVVGMGAGQPNRVTSVHLALRAAGQRAENAALASDAFFPFADNIELLAEGGIAAVAQPGGSIRDDQVIAAANKLRISMVFTGVRHFRH